MFHLMRPSPRQLSVAIKINPAGLRSLIWPAFRQDVMFPARHFCTQPPPGGNNGHGKPKDAPISAGNQHNDAKLPMHKKKIAGSPYSWRAFAVTSVLGAAMLGLVKWAKYAKNQKIAEKQKQASEESIGKALIGGPWQLVDTTGALKSDKDYLGTWVLLYFGFTHCPDICPDELEKMCKVANNFIENPSLPSIQPLFITIDPSRDTQEAIAKYCADFSSTLVGLTGSYAQIDDVTRAFRVYYSEGPKDEDGDYIVDHTIVMYLLDPDGHFCAYYGQSHNVEKITDSILGHVLKWGQAKHGIGAGR